MLNVVESAPKLFAEYQEGFKIATMPSFAAKLIRSFTQNNHVRKMEVSWERVNFNPGRPTGCLRRRRDDLPNLTEREAKSRICEVRWSRCVDDRAVP